MRSRRGPATVTGQRKPQAHRAPATGGDTEPPGRCGRPSPGSQETCPRPAMTTLEERVAQMPRLVPSRLVAACALALALVLCLPRPRRPRSVTAQLRVLGSSGNVLAERPLGIAGQVSVRTSPRATCFGAGTGGSGKARDDKGATPLGVLLRASQHDRSAAPAAVTDAFSFGLALCDVGGSRATKKLSWYLKIDHASPSVGGEAARVSPGDEVLWALAPLSLPGRARAERPRVTRRRACRSACASSPTTTRAQRSRRRVCGSAARARRPAPTGARR